MGLSRTALQAFRTASRQFYLGVATKNVAARYNFKDQTSRGVEGAEKDYTTHKCNPL